MSQKQLLQQVAARIACTLQVGASSQVGLGGPVSGCQPLARLASGQAVDRLTLPMHQPVQGRQRCVQDLLHGSIYHHWGRRVMRKSS